MSGLSESPDAIGTLLSTLESESGEGTSDTPPDPAETPREGQEPPAEGSQPNPPKEPGITAPKLEGEQAKPPAEQKQSPFPKALEPYKPLLDGKKWDPAKPDWVVEPLKALQEAEQMNGRQSTDLGLTRSRVAEMTQAIHGTPKEINDLRQRAGLQPLPFESTSLEDKIKAAEGEWTLLEQALSQDEKVSTAATQKIIRGLQERMENLRLEKKVAELHPPKGKGDDLQNSAKTNWSRITEQFPDANTKLSSLVPFLATKFGTGLLGSFGMDPHSILSTPERAKQAYELADRLWRGDPENFKAEVTKAVSAEMEKNRMRGNGGAIPGGAPPAIPADANAPEGVEGHFAGMFANRR